MREAATTPRVTVHMVSSLDGFIARSDGSVSWLETSDRYDPGVDGEDAAEFLETVGCFVVGSRTYETALELGWPYGDVPTIVLSHRDLPVTRESVELYSGDLTRLVNDRLKPRYGNIWVVGGSTVAGDFIRLQLADDVRLSIAPVLLGEGVPFFDRIDGEWALHLKDVTAYRNGIVDLWYEIRA
ncbi:MAG TPA: dihydrofolate reductase family protein [Gaiellaceae bacterium]